MLGFIQQNHLHLKNFKMESYKIYKKKKFIYAY